MLFLLLFLSNTINLVDDFGADPTGVLNSVTQLRQARDFVELYGSKLEIPPGIYRLEVNSVADLEQGSIISQYEHWSVIEGHDVVFDVYPKTLTFPFSVFGLKADKDSNISGIDFDGACTLYHPLNDGVWSYAFEIKQGTTSNKAHITISDCDFLGIWNSGVFKNGGLGQTYLDLSDMVFERTVTQAIGVFAGDDQEVQTHMTNVHIVESGLPNWGHGVYIHPHISVLADKLVIDKAYKFGFNYFSSGGNQTVKPKYAIIKNSTFGKDIVLSAISHGGPPKIQLISQNNKFYCNAFYYGFGVTSINDTYEYETPSQAVLVGNQGTQNAVVSGSIQENEVLYKFINPKAVNAKFRIASDNLNNNYNTFVLDGGEFLNSYIEQTHAVENLPQKVIIRNLNSSNIEANYLFRPLAGHWDVSNFFVDGSFNAAPWAAPILLEWQHKISSYRVSNGQIRSTGKAMVDRNEGQTPPYPNPLILVLVQW